MKFGVREICDVVLRAKAKQTIGSKVFYKDEPVLYFDSLKTSTMEGAATTVYAQGGKGNSRLIAWEGERTVTFTMEDALISAEGLAILTGADMIDAKDTTMYVHATQTVGADDVTINAANEDEGIEASVTITLDPDKTGTISTHDEAKIYVMLMNDGEIISEPYTLGVTAADKTITIPADNNDLAAFEDEQGNKTFDAVFVDYYEEKTAGYQIDITPDKFGGNYYLEASTLFKNTDGIDLPAEFIIPNCKVQSNFTFTMASSGDPSTFTFTMDAFPDYTRFDKTKKVLSVIQVIEDADNAGDVVRPATAHDHK